MKIGSSIDLSPAADTQLRAGRSAPSTAAAAPVAGASDQVSVSAAGAQLGGLGSSDFDHAKVEQIRQAMREGRFHVNAGAIADRLIADATALLGPRA
ncbi:MULTISPECIES: flagellar biosynthesis anti-sigma factor FlgM [Ramlibacter]|uniref:Negative regulator of flagellin synthesis n=1 Tax=Ramlibacter aquaticus TaxID=2780094 RepID=A0ABR9SA02_9BURK|nr:MULTISPECIES: flagellar biosynthesis anti-sigma factor FlgM [Ramlibacter]MBE7939178.1 flagellar biosynthesis anti-sigma factor FlgM [Ramlibacter aquaticus]